MGICRKDDRVARTLSAFKVTSLKGLSGAAVVLHVPTQAPSAMLSARHRAQGW